MQTLTTSPNVLNKVSQLPQPTINPLNITDVLSSPIEVHLVDKNDVFYHKGRILAEDVYRQVWNTENLVDGNDYGIVVVSNNTVVGNVNLQLKNSQTPLKSETFFREKHWEYYFNTSSERIAELSGLSASQEISPEARKIVSIILFLGLHISCKSLGIDLLVTVQRKALNRILSKRFNFIFVTNQHIITPQKQVPNDKYWKSSEMPQLHYLNVKSTHNINSMNRSSHYLDLKGIDVEFLPRLRTSSTAYPFVHHVGSYESQSA